MYPFCRFLTLSIETTRRWSYLNVIQSINKS